MLYDSMFGDSERLCWIASYNNLLLARRLYLVFRIIFVFVSEG